jgi:hypothetical protein
MKESYKELHIRQDIAWNSSPYSSLLKVAEIVSVEAMYKGVTLSEVEEVLACADLRYDLEREWASRLAIMVEEFITREKMNVKCVTPALAISLKFPFVKKVSRNIYGSRRRIGETIEMVSFNPSYIEQRIQWGVDHHFVFWKKGEGERSVIDRPQYVLNFLWESPGVLVTRELADSLEKYWKRLFWDYNIIR